MILKGRFTNARRAHLNAAGDWEHIEQDFNFVNIKKISRGIYRSDFGFDVESINVPIEWKREFESDKVLIHLFRDILWLVANDPMCELDMKLVKFYANNQNVLNAIEESI